jgi:putative alpha-1,2-mannosidase
MMMVMMMMLIHPSIYSSIHPSIHPSIMYLLSSLTHPLSSDQVVHYSPYDPHGRTFPGPLVTDNGFWDTFRTVYPLLSLAYPDHLGTIIQGWLNAFKEGGDNDNDDDDEDVST